MSHSTQFENATQPEAMFYTRYVHESASNTKFPEGLFKSAKVLPINLGLLIRMAFHNKHLQKLNFCNSVKTEGFTTY